MNLEASRFTVVGAGRSGLAAANALARRGADVRLIDGNPQRERPAELSGDVVFQSGTNAPRPGDVAVLSPGIKEVSPVRGEIAAIAGEVIGEVELFYRLCPAPVLAVTGTDGKSTVTTMLGEIVAATGAHTFVGGNLGNPLCDDVDDLTSESVVVAEISAFQLTTNVEFRPRVAVVTNIAEDHIDYHGSFTAYQAAKRRIWERMTHADTLVINGDDPYIGRWTLPPSPALKRFSLERPADASLSGDTLWVGDEPVMHRDQLQLLGRHNIANALAAAQAAVSFGVPRAAVRQGLMGYRPLAHRLATVATIDGTRWINDSKATNTNAASAGLEAVQRPLVLLAGGSDKGADFSALGALIRERTDAAVLFGQTRDQLADAVGPQHPVHLVETLDEAVARARQIATGQGWSVLLSPACASFDQFKSYAHRGDVFEALVRGLQ